jgi:hypothetical protein
MQLPVAILGCVLILGSTALTVGDYAGGPVESPQRLQLGRFYLTDDAGAIDETLGRLDELGFRGALKVYRPALAHDPASAFRWTKVGGMLQAAGDLDGAKYCYRRADLLAPHDPRSLFEIGDYDISVEDSASAVRHFSRILAVAHREEDAVIVQNVFNYYEQLRVRDLGLLDAAIPDAFSARIYLKYLTSRVDPAHVRSVWQWMHTKGYDDAPNTNSYLWYLFSKRQYAAAAEDWSAHLASGEHRVNDGFPAKTAIYNGGFEYESVRIPFDWWNEDSKITVTRDSDVHHEGNYSMRVELSGSGNPELQALRQNVAVAPGRYRLDAFLRTDAVTSSEGVRIAVRGGGSGPVIAETEALNGTNDFTSLGVTFEVPPGTSLIEVYLARHRALRVDNQLSGKVWLDSVSLTHVAR